MRGYAVVETIAEQPGGKRRNRCPRCHKTTIKERRRARPRFRCKCGKTFDEADERAENCLLYEAHFGNSFHDLHGQPSIDQLWAVAPRLSKQNAIIELDGPRAASLLERRDDRPIPAGQTNRR